MPETMIRFTRPVLLIATLATASPAGGQPCIGVERTAEKPRILYDGNPKPLVILPLILSEVEEIGAIQPGEHFTVCSRIDRSTWNRRSAWLYVRVHGRPEGSTGSSGWINLSRAEAETWLPTP